MPFWNSSKVNMVAEQDALPGRAESMRIPVAHEVLGNPLIPPFPDGFETIVVGMGCFWGAERLFWQHAGVWTTAWSPADRATCMKVKMASSAPEWTSTSAPESPGLSAAMASRRAGWPCDSV